MSTELDSETNITSNHIEFALIQTKQHIQKQSLPLFLLPEHEHISLEDQYSERYRENMHKRYRMRTKSVVNNQKEQSGSKKEILYFPGFRRVETSCERESRNYSSSNVNNSSKVFNKFPKIQKLNPIEQVLAEAKLEYTRQYKKVVGVPINSGKLGLECKTMELKTIKDEIIPPIKHIKRPTKPPVPPFIPSFARPQIPSPNTQPMRIIAKYTEKKQIQTLKTKDSIQKTQSPEKVVTLKYKKGYLIYDIQCLNLFRRRQQMSPLFDLSEKIPNISARNYCVMQIDTLRPIILVKENNLSSQIASLTKIVTCLLTILTCKKYDVDMTSYKTRVSEEASLMPGTTAELQSGDILTIQQLLFGLMLPSGNDAAVALAQSLGKIIQRKKKLKSNANPLQIFVKQMNVLYKQLLLLEAQQPHNFKNPSGLVLNPNITNVEQIAAFAAVACSNTIFHRIVNTQIFDISIQNVKHGISRKMQWKNTNKLLWKGWEGVKTGTTENAGHCFIGKYGKYIYALLDCETLDKRFEEAEVLKSWMTNNLQSQFY